MHPCIRLITVATVLLLPALPASAITVAEAKRGPTNVLNIAEVDRQPVPVKRTAPFYSPELRAAKAEGGVMVEFIIGVNGDVVDAHATDSDDIRLNEAAVAAVKTWQYKPAKNRGLAVNCRTSQLVVFSLK